MTDENFTSYEMMLIVDPTLGDDRTREVIEELKTQIQSLGGAMTFEDFWGSRYLSYKIKKYDKGFYVVLNFNLPPTKLLELSNDLRLNQSIVRFITLKTPKNYEILTLEALEKDAEKYKRVRKEDAKEGGKEERKEDKVERAPRIAKPKIIEVEKKVEVKEEVKKEVKVEKPEVVEEVKEEPKEEIKEEPKEKESKITDLDDVDAKLKSIMDDPDISL